MADEPDVIAPPTVVDQPSTADYEPEQPVDLDAIAEADDADLPEGDDYEPAEELEEFEWNGKAIKGPKGLKDGVLMQADYTRKTQEISATRKELEAQKARVAEQAKASEDYIELKADHRALNRDLSAYENVDWNAWSLQDPIACQQGYIAYQNLQREAGELSQRISQADSQRSAETQQETARRLHETHEFAKQNIKGWSDDRARKVIEFAKEQGFSNEDLQASLNPATIKILHLAELGSQVLNKSAAPKIPQKAPLTVVGGKSSAPVRKPLSEMSMEEYASFRKRQEAAKRG
jgi:hypothetical protein